MSRPVVEMTDITKTYVVRAKTGRLRRERRDVRAVDHVNFAIQPGEMVGYLGPNGAGKSTTIKMLTGILQPTEGKIEVLGLRPTTERTKLAREIGVVFGQRTQLWWDLPLGDSFDLLHHLYRTDAKRHRHNLSGFVDRLDLGHLLGTPVRQLSLGERMRGELTAALLHEPSLVVLDEPTIGLDVVSKYAVREFLQLTNRDHGTTVLLTTHDLTDVEQLCERMLIIDHGRVVLDGSVAEFKKAHGTHRTVVVDLDRAEAPIDVPEGEVVKTEGPRQWIRFDRTRTNAAEVIAAVSKIHTLNDVSIEEPEIEELIRHLYESGE